MSTLTGVTVSDPPEEIGVDLTESEVLYAKGRELVAKRKTANHHLRIEHISADNVGEYNCTLRLYKKDFRTKKFSVVLGSDPRLSSAERISLTLSISCIILVMISLIG
ncbi:hypothetical protein COOONC_16463 [Cooperia oncophora]